tara:strand:- start:372 stop:581 length:210 start_codon:yes stop_codon:yes gene_type:complete
MPLSDGDFDLCEAVQDNCCVVVLRYSYGALKKSLVKMLIFFKFFIFWDLVGPTTFEIWETHKKGRYFSQ